MSANDDNVKKKEREKWRAGKEAGKIIFVVMIRRISRGLKNFLPLAMFGFNFNWQAVNGAIVESISCECVCAWQCW
jgi:hypothetical protein